MSQQQGYGPPPGTGSRRSQGWSGGQQPPPGYGQQPPPDGRSRRPATASSPRPGAVNSRQPYGHQQPYGSPPQQFDFSPAALRRAAAGHPAARHRRHGADRARGSARRPVDRRSFSRCLLHPRAIVGRCSSRMIVYSPNTGVHRRGLFVLAVVLPPLVGGLLYAGSQPSHDGRDGHDARPDGHGAPRRREQPRRPDLGDADEHSAVRPGIARGAQPVHLGLRSLRSRSASGSFVLVDRIFVLTELSTAAGAAQPGQYGRSPQASTPPDAVRRSVRPAVPGQAPGRQCGGTGGTRSTGSHRVRPARRSSRPPYGQQPAYGSPARTAQPYGRYGSARVRHPDRYAYSPYGTPPPTRRLGRRRRVRGAPGRRA